MNRLSLDGLGAFFSFELEAMSDYIGAAPSLGSEEGDPSSYFFISV